MSSSLVVFSTRHFLPLKGAQLRDDGPEELGFGASARFTNQRGDTVFFFDAVNYNGSERD
jgi:hypothetical protein